MRLAYFCYFLDYQAFIKLILLVLLQHFTIMIQFTIIFIVIICVLLTLIVLAQNPKGSGLSSQFGGSGATQIMGAKRTTDVLEKITWGIGMAIFALCLLVNVNLGTGGNTGGYVSPVIDQTQQTTPTTTDTTVPVIEGESTTTDETTNTDETTEENK
jgi:preprotein translocase subunit SecG